MLSYTICLEKERVISDLVPLNLVQCLCLSYYIIDIKNQCFISFSCQTAGFRVPTWTSVQSMVQLLIHKLFPNLRPGGKRLYTHTSFYICQPIDLTGLLWCTRYNIIYMYIFGYMPSGLCYMTCAHTDGN